ncbi:MAG TPA: tetratricopeptide repeat protein [bacterium]|nr:tetratricopeptide repeat protein [bacterium]
MRIFFSFTFFFFIFLNVQHICAENSEHSFIDGRRFTKDVKDALISGEESMLLEKTAMYLKEKEISHIPNCFECSLFLIRSTIDSSSAVQLVAADLAVKFSPDLPEARLHFISRLIKFAPFKTARILSETREMIKAFFCFPPRDAFFYSVLNTILKACLVFIFIYFLIIGLKYPSLIIHRYMHLAGHSKFYAVSLALVVALSSWILVQNEHNLFLVIMTFLVFLTGVSVLREKIILYAVFIIALLAHGGIILTGASEDPSIDRKTAMNNLYAVYSPSSSDIGKIELSAPGGQMARGFIHFYKDEHEKAVFHLKKELGIISDGKIKTSIHNILGLSLAALGNYKEAVSYLKTAYDESGNIHIGYNLAKTMYEGGMTEDATNFEKQLLETAGAVTLSYPHIEYTGMFRAWRYVSSGKTGDRFENWVRFFLFILSALFFYMMLLLVQMNYIKGISLSRCLECGIVMCSKCNAGGQHVCVVCKLMKADPEVFLKGEKEKYEVRRNRFFARHSVYTSIFNFMCPGGGLIFSNKVLEGSAYLFITVFLSILIVNRNTGLVFNINTGDSGTMTFILTALIAVIYLISIVRGFFVSRGD